MLLNRYFLPRLAVASESFGVSRPARSRPYHSFGLSSSGIQQPTDDTDDKAGWAGDDLLLLLLLVLLFIIPNLRYYYYYKINLNFWSDRKWGYKGPFEAILGSNEWYWWKAEFRTVFFSIFSFFGFSQHFSPTCPKNFPQKLPLIGYP